MEMSTVYQLKKGVIARKSKTGSFLTLYNPDTNTLLEFNDSAGDILKYIDGTNDISSIIEKLSFEYSVEDKQIVKEDVLYFINRLIELEALETIR